MNKDRDPFRRPSAGTGPFQSKHISIDHGSEKLPGQESAYTASWLGFGAVMSSWCLYMLELADVSLPYEYFFFLGMLGLGLTIFALVQYRDRIVEFHSAPTRFARPRLLERSRRISLLNFAALLAWPVMIGIRVVFQI